MNISTKMTEAILDYWFAIEFLSQDKYPNVYEIQNIVKKHKRELKEGKASRKSIETFIQLNEEAKVLEGTIADNLRRFFED